MNQSSSSGLFAGRFRPFFACTIIATATHTYEHKIGGYPSFCQSGVDPGEGFEFVFQISSDSKINLNVVDSGSLMFWKHNETGEWALYYDFY